MKTTCVSRRLLGFGAGLIVIGVIGSVSARTQEPNHSLLLADPTGAHHNAMVHNRRGQYYHGLHHRYRPYHRPHFVPRYRPYYYGPPYDRRYYGVPRFGYYDYR